MKKTMVYTIIALLSLGVLAGCGRMGDRGENMLPTERPAVSASPMIVSPDPEDGYVRDEDGIITDDDTGRDGNGLGGAMGPSASPSANPGANGTAGTGTPNGNRTASPSPSASADTGTDRQ